MKPTKSSLIKKNDALARQINRIIYKNKCCRCGRDGDTYQLDWSHVYGRSSKVLRWSEDNALLLCRNCHFNFWHIRPLDASQWFESKYPGRKSRLQKKLNRNDPMTIQTYMKINDQLTKRLEECQKR